MRTCPIYRSGVEVSAQKKDPNQTQNTTNTEILDSKMFYTFGLPGELASLILAVFFLHYNMYQNGVELSALKNTATSW